METWLLVSIQGPFYLLQLSFINFVSDKMSPITIIWTLLHFYNAWKWFVFVKMTNCSLKFHKLRQQLRAIDFFWCWEHIGTEFQETEMAAPSVCIQSSFLSSLADVSSQCCHYTVKVCLLFTVTSSFVLSVCSVQTCVFSRYENSVYIVSLF